MGALLGAFFYFWATPKTGSKAQIKMSWNDAGALALLVLLLGALR